MNSLKSINEILKAHKEDLYRKYSVVEIGVFGSIVRGEQKKRRGLVDFEKVPDLIKFINLERYLSRLLKKKVDLCKQKSHSTGIKRHDFRRGGIYMKPNHKLFVFYIPQLTFIGEKLKETARFIF
jgi:predicted nucleotidyltransferase